jgi:hypothetical protein
LLKEGKSFVQIPYKTMLMYGTWTFFLGTKNPSRRGGEQNMKNGKKKEVNGKNKAEREK